MTRYYKGIPLSGDSFKMQEKLRMTKAQPKIEESKAEEPEAEELKVEEPDVEDPGVECSEDEELEAEAEPEPEEVETFKISDLNRKNKSGLEEIAGNLNLDVKDMTKKEIIKVILAN